MSTYADKASKGKIGEEIPVDQQKVDKEVKEAKAKITKKLDEMKDKSKKVINEESKNFDKNLDKAENAIVKFVKDVSSSIGYYLNVGAEQVGATSYTAKEELKNPVVASQAVIVTGLIAGGIYAYQERLRIKRIPDDVLYVYAAVLTGLVVLDGFTFKKLYSKYKK